MNILGKRRLGVGRRITFKTASLFIHALRFSGLSKSIFPSNVISYHCCVFFSCYTNGLWVFNWCHLRWSSSQYIPELLLLVSMNLYPWICNAYMWVKYFLEHWYMPANIPLISCAITLYVLETRGEAKVFTLTLVRWQHSPCIKQSGGKQRYVITLIAIPTLKWYIQMMLIKSRALIFSICQYHCNDAMYQSFSYCFIVLICPKWSETSHLMLRSFF